MFQISCIQHSMWHAQVNTSLPWNPYFSPVGRPIAVSGRSGVGIQFCLADESNVPSGLELESCIVGQDRTPSRNVYIQNHRDWCSSFPPPFFSLSSCCRPSQTGSQPSLAPTRILPPLPLCLPPPAFPSSARSLLWRRDDKSIPWRLGHLPSQHFSLTN